MDALKELHKNAYRLALMQQGQFDREELNPSAVIYHNEAIGKPLDNFPVLLIVARTDMPFPGHAVTVTISRPRLYYHYDADAYAYKVFIVDEEAYYFFLKNILEGMEVIAKRYPSSSKTGITYSKWLEEARKDLSEIDEFLSIECGLNSLKDSKNKPQAKKE